MLYPKWKLSEMQSQYRQLISVYARILSEKATKTAANTRTKSLFPSKHTWNTVGRTLTSSEREMLIGPSQHVNVYKKLSVRDKGTNSLIEYSYTDVGLIPNSIPKQSSSFVILNAADEFVRSKPLFGVVVKMFSHSFAQNTFYWAVVQQFEEPVFDSELKMWYVCVNVGHTYTSSLIILRNLSYPLVIAVDDNKIWFLNS